MITVTIEGPQGSGKSRIARAIQEYCDLINRSCIHKYEVVGDIKFPTSFDVVIIEKQAR